MKNNKLIAILLAFMLVLSSCGKIDADISRDNLPLDTNSEFNLSQRNQEKETCYAFESYSTTIDEESQVSMAALVFQGEIFLVTTSTPVPDGFKLQHVNEVIYTSQNYFYAATSSPEGIWILENNYADGKSNYLLRLVSSDGNVQRTIDLRSVCNAETFSRSLVYNSNNLYLISEGKQLVALDTNGNFICSINLPDDQSYPVASNNGEIYIVQPTIHGNQFYLIDAASSSLTKKFLSENGDVFNGYENNFLILENDTGLYSITTNGSIEPVINWAECNISIGSMFSINPLKDGQLLCLVDTGPGILLPEASTETKAKTSLQLAAINPSVDLKKIIFAFNNSDSDYFIQINDYSDNGKFDANTAITRLNTEIISGNYPDMICFSHICPDSYIRKGILTDMSDFFDKDEDIKAKDVAILNALASNDGVYYISRAFTFETLVGRFSEFGDRYGWTLSEYLNIEQSLPNDVETIHNMTKESFINCIVSRYIRKAVNWDEGTCNFDSNEFIELLEAGNRIRETPEDLNNMSFGYGPAKVGEGTNIASLSLVETPWKLAYEEYMAGCKLSFIGWPTVDGDCGSDVYLIDPIGIVSQGDNIEGCWKFIRFMLLNADIDSYNLPVYMPLLQEAVNNAKKSEDNPIQITDNDSERFYDLISSMENVAIYDETVLDIIRKESASFFYGDKTAEEAAKIIQSKVSIYVAEQG